MSVSLALRAGLVQVRCSVNVARMSGGQSLGKDSRVGLRDQDSGICISWGGDGGVSSFPSPKLTLISCRILNSKFKYATENVIYGTYINNEPDGIFFHSCTKCVSFFSFCLFVYPQFKSFLRYCYCC